MGKRDKLPAFWAEPLPMEEVSLEKTRDGRLMYTTNLVLHETRRLLDAPDKNVPISLKPEQVTHDLARNQALIYIAMDKRVQHELRINNGDYVVSAGGDSLNWGIITLNRDMTKQLSLDAFLIKTLTHSERGFSSRTGSQQEFVSPFATYPQQTLAGIWDGFEYMRAQGKDIPSREAYLSALTRVAQVLEARDDVENLTGLQDAITDYTASA